MLAVVHSAEYPIRRIHKQLPCIVGAVVPVSTPATLPTGRYLLSEVVQHALLERCRDHVGVIVEPEQGKARFVTLKCIVQSSFVVGYPLGYGRSLREGLDRCNGYFDYNLPMVGSVGGSRMIEHILLVVADTTIEDVSAIAKRDLGIAYAEVGQPIPLSSYSVISQTGQ